MKRENIAASPLVNASNSSFECYPNTSFLVATTPTSRYMARRVPRNLGPYVRHGLVENHPDQSPPAEFECRENVGFVAIGKIEFEVFEL